jgi:hypothetical protein
VGIAPFNFNLNTVSSGYLPSALAGTVLCRFPALILACNDLSIGSYFGFSSTTTFPELSTYPACLSTFCLASSEITGYSPFILRVKKNLPDFEFLSGTVDANAPAFFLLFNDASIGSFSLYISSISSASDDFDPTGSLEDAGNTFFFVGVASNGFTGLASVVLLVASFTSLTIFYSIFY